MANNGIKSVGERELSSLVSILKQLDDNFFEPTSTAVADLPIKEREEPVYPDPGSISEDPRGFIQKSFDQLYGSGPMGAAAAAIADILPGIPFVDVADPPQELEDQSMQQARNILGVLSMVGGISKTPQAVGRVATNIREPFGYGDNWGAIQKAMDRLQYQDLTLKQVASGDVKGKSIAKKVKELVGSVVKDKPMYGRLDPRLDAIPEKIKKDSYLYDEPIEKKAVGDAREFLYRKMFGLKPRAGKNIFIENKDGTLSFNPKSERAGELMKEIVEGSRYQNQPKYYHSVMGGYKRKVRQPEDPKSDIGLSYDAFKTEGALQGYVPRLYSKSTELDYADIVDYEDIWDFKMNPSDWAEVFNAFTESPKRAFMGTGMAAVRSLANMITNPSHIKGTVYRNKWGRFLPPSD